MAITNRTLQLIQQLRDEIGAISDSQVRDIVEAWVRAWDEIEPDLEASILGVLADAKDGTVSFTKIAQNRRLAQALVLIGDQLEALAEAAQFTITQGLSDAIREAVETNVLIIKSQLPPGHTGLVAGFDRIDPEAISTIISRSTQRIHSDFRPLSAAAVRAMKKELIRAVIVGDNPRTTARRILKRSEGAFNGGLTRALTIARTEMLDAHRAGTKASESVNADILTEWEWHASLTARTCPGCWGKHGQRFPLDEQGPNDHQNGRCTRVTVTKSWKDLGFDIEEPKSLTPDAEQVFKNLTPETQRDIMGPARLQKLNDGEISWADLAAKRENPGWRDSFVPTPVKDL